MLHLILVRHGETDWNVVRRFQGQTDTALNVVGREQAARLARRLAGWGVDAAYASDLKRAWETAEAAGAALGVAVEPEPRLREMGFGLLEGLTFDEAQARYPAHIETWLADREQPFPGGERYSTFSARVAAVLADLKARHDGQIVLLVTHGGPVKELLRLALGLPPDGKWVFQIDNASLTELKLYGDQPLLTRLNDTHHLDGTQAGSASHVGEL